VSAFDPFTATAAEAQADAHRPLRPVQQWAGAEELQHRRGHFERRWLDGLAVCARCGIVSPDSLVLDVRRFAS
jgi:hypothetical protein